MNDDRDMVIVVDDDVSVRISLARLLSSAQLPFTMYGSAEEFLHNVPTTAGGCAVIDIHLPASSGLDLQKMIAQRYPDLSVVIITAFDEEDAEQQALANGAVAFLRKPFDAEALLRLLRSTLVKST
jgi:two-component system response regulator FixJ